MTNPTARLVVYDDVTHLDFYDRLTIGDTLVVSRVGPRQGDRMGTATVTELRR